MSTLKNIYHEQYNKRIEELGVTEKDQMRTIFLTFYSAVTNSFKWNGMTKNVPFFFPERWLYLNGLIAGYKDEDHFDIYPAFGNGMITEYGQFTSYNLVKMNGETMTKSFDEVELCYNNSLMIPSFIMVNELANKCNTALTAVNNTLIRASFARIIECSDEKELDKILGILSNKDTSKIALTTISSAIKTGGITVHNLFDNKCDDVLALWDVYVRYRNMFYSTFGFDNVEIQKRERLTEAEGSANAEIVRYGLFDDMFSCREDFVKRCNERFGSSLSVEINRNPASVYNMRLSNDEKIENELIEISKGSNLPTVDEKGGEENVNANEN